MAKTIYNEGRVVGYSAYEVYVRHALADDPDTPPATETEWLSSTIAMGSSMLLKVTADSVAGTHYRDFDLPANSKLCAANTVIGSFFEGSGHFPAQSIWADRITDYGLLISNTSSSSPANSVTDAKTIPRQNIAAWNPAKKVRLCEYMKIIDGVVLQPGSWPSSSAKPPEKDFQPNLRKTPVVRLLFSDKVTTEFYLLLTGFTIRTVISGTVGKDSSVNTTSPQDGDFLGPAVYPWANKIVFSVPNAFVNYFLKDNYARKLPADSANAKYVKTSAIIDMEHTDPKTYYASKDTDSRVAVNVTEVNSYGQGASVLTVYQRSDMLPPALYGTKVSSTGSQYIHPLDVHAPGTLTLYEYSRSNKSDQLSKAEARETIPANTAFVRDSSSLVVHELTGSKEGDVIGTVPVSDDRTENIGGSLFLKLIHMGWFGGSNTYDDRPENPAEGYVRDIHLNNVIIYRRMYSIVPQKILDEFAFEASDARLKDSGALYDWWSCQMINDLRDTSKYPGGQNNLNNYYVIAIGQSGIMHESDTPAIKQQQYFYCPIRKSDNVLDVCIPYFFPLSEMKGKFKFNTEARQNYLGSRAESGGGGDFDWVGGHPKVYQLSSSTKFRHDEAFAPKLGNLTLSGIMNEYDTKKLSSLFTTAELDALGIHTSWRNLTLWQFIQGACTQKVTKAYGDSSNKTVRSINNLGLGGKRYIYKRQAFIDVMTHYQSGTGLYATEDNSILLDFDPVPGAPLQEKMNVYPEEYVPVGSGTNMYAAKGESGRHSSKAISLVDTNSDDLPLTGSSGVIDVDNSDLNWYHLMLALGNDKSINTLGVRLKSARQTLIRQEGDEPGQCPYLEFGPEDNKKRLYISSVEPVNGTGENAIPVGSIGIGWGMQ